jgi:acetyl esterase/lipase
MDNMRPLAAALTEAGIATWNIEYRRLGNDGGGWPGTFRDVATGADFLRTFARDRQLDLTRVIAIGHSAGAHLALWLASRHKLTPASDLYTNDPIRLIGAVSLDGPADLQATIPLQQSICRAPVITDLIGGSPEQQPQRYRDASPIAMLPLGVRHVFFTGQMFGSHSAPYAAAVKKAGEAAEVIPFPGAGHFVFIDPESMIWPEVMKSVRQMLAMP